MFDRLIDLVIQIVVRLRVCAIVPQYESGVVLRWGRHQRDIGPGLCWLIPVIDELTTCSVIPHTEVTRVQSLTTNNGVSLTVACAVTWHVTDPAKHLLGVNDGSDAVLDLLAGAIGAVVQSDDGSATPGDLAAAIRRQANRRAHLWGLRIDRVSFATYAQAPCYRLIQDRGARIDE